MARETKIGMVVASIFLSLVGLVVASKVKKPEPTPDAVAVVTPDKSKPSDPEPPKNSPPAKPLETDTHGGTVGQKSNDPKKTIEKPDPMPNSPTAPVERATFIPPAPAGEPAAPATPGLGVTTPTKAPGAPDVPGAPSSPASPTEPPVTIASGLPEVNLPSVKAPAVQAPEVKAPEVKAPDVPPVPGPPVDPPQKSPGSLPAVPTVVDAPKLNPGSPLPIEPVAKPETTLPKDPLAGGTRPEPSALPKDPLGAGTKPEPSGLPKDPSFPVPPVPASGKPDPVMPPAVPNVPGLPKVDTKPIEPAPTAPMKNVDVIAPPLGSGPLIAPKKSDLPAPSSIGTIGRVTPDAPPLTSAGAASLTLPANKTLPTVTNIADNTYAVQGETSFADLSTKLYGSPNYAQALMEYNRNHVLATTSMKQNPQQLQANQPIYYPDQNVLEIRYPKLITGGASATTAPALPTVKISTPTPLAAPPVANPPTADATVTFRVTQPQFIFDIARQQLGDGMLWTEILRLNPLLHTDQPIPAGTELRLPRPR